jgi:hypothetical protein
MAFLSAAEESVTNRSHACGARFAARRMELALHVYLEVVAEGFSSLKEKE